GAGALIDMALASEAGPGKQSPRVLLVSPAEVVESPNPFGHKFDKAIERSQQLAPAYEEVARDKGAAFFSAASVATCPDTDGIHIDEAGHRALGEALAQEIRKLI
ncbi:MAG: hypothetical protein AAF492_23910, partial [Verrucomicrobiota bacterium]